MIPTLLLLDDDVESRDRYAAYFEGEGFRVLRASGGEEALALIGADRPDAIVSAYPIPLRDGRTVCAAVRGSFPGYRPAIVAHTTWTWPRTREHAIAEGCDLFLEKPTAPEALHDALAGLLRPLRVASRPALLPRSRRAAVPRGAAAAVGAVASHA